MTAPDYADADRAIDAWWRTRSPTWWHDSHPVPETLNGVVHAIVDAERARVVARERATLDVNTRRRLRDSADALDAEQAKTERLTSELATVRSTLEKEREVANDCATLETEIDRLRAEIANLIRPKHDADGTIEIWTDEHAHTYSPTSLLVDVRAELATVRAELEKAHARIAGADGERRWVDRKIVELEAENARLRAALTTIGAWDCLNPPRPELLHDLPWLRRTIDAALAAPPPPAMCATCVAILAADVSRHFRECPLRAKYPEPAKAALGGAKPARDGMRIVLAAIPTDDALITCLACRRENCDLEMRVTPPHNNTGQAVAGMHRACLEKYTAAQGEADEAKERQDAMFTMAEFRERAEVEAVGHARSGMMLRLATEYDRALADLQAAREEVATLTAERDRAVGLLKDSRQQLRACDANVCDCDDESGGLGRTRRSEWCGGPCALRESIDNLLRRHP